MGATQLSNNLCQLVASAAYLFEFVSTWLSMLYHEGVLFALTNELFQLKQIPK